MVAEAENRIADKIENLIAGIGRSDIGRNGAPAGSVIGLMPAKKITTGRSLFFVGMEPKRDQQERTSSDLFAKVIEFSNEAEAGTQVGPFFERIANLARTGVTSFFDFSHLVLGEAATQTKANRQEAKGSTPQHGVSTRVTVSKRHFFTRGARSSLSHMRSGPCVFVTISRNFASWVAADCPGPDIIGEFSSRPRWDQWIGRSDGRINNLLSKFETPSLDGLKREFTEFGHVHVMLLFPNPCYERNTIAM